MLYRIINKEDRKTFYYDGSRIVRRYRRVRSATTTAATTSPKPPARQPSVQNRTVSPIRAVGSSSVKARRKSGVIYTGEYHKPRAKRARKAARQEKSRRYKSTANKRYKAIM